MRRSLVGLIPLLALACAGSTTPTVRVDGVWTLTSTPFTPVEPRSLDLRQQGSTVTGTGTAMGVDTPFLLPVTGTFQNTVLDIQLGDTAHNTQAGRITATLTSANQLVGRFKADTNAGGGSDTVTYTRQ
ncbi:MAG TPA: hypothetical protein VFW98_11635 [Gemmatimonadaceae bacterium]|nr:hypothetical protein [Gemmatimonadaceae bacterium]